MRTELALEVDVTRLFEFTDEIGEREQRCLDSRGIFGSGPQRTVAAFAAGEEGCAAAQVENQITPRFRAVARHLEGECRSRRWLRRRIIVDDKIESAEMPFRCRDRAAMDRHARD